jgi:hypothetical protein
MNRRAVLTSLIHFNAPLANLRAALTAFDWDSDPIVTLTRQYVVAILHRLEGGEIDAAAVAEWANLLECRDDVLFEIGREGAVSKAIFVLANPEIHGELHALVAGLLTSLG